MLVLYRLKLILFKIYCFLQERRAHELTKLELQKLQKYFEMVPNYNFIILLFYCVLVLFTTIVNVILNILIIPNNLIYIQTFTERKVVIFNMKTTLP
ncbi:unnamed protein product [Thelazia callipaeda]|uniref:G-protein coupled receptors family 1 profile domain-containing protein n=1 Tax=Thelazia callipaeda TaxID=103827 RepID=A0A0N5D914_THECL|nr:unnamed protein product [Thelazia callipaeda]